MSLLDFVFGGHIVRLAAFEKNCIDITVALVSSWTSCQLS